MARFGYLGIFELFYIIIFILFLIKKRYLKLKKSLDITQAQNIENGKNNNKINPFRDLNSIL
jgi:hypothetical protein